MRANVTGIFAMLACALVDPAWSAELNGSRLVEPASSIAFHRTMFPACRTLWTCGSHGCRAQRICPRGCPDRYSCYPLYGAYGPYGGVGYWGGFSP